MHHDDAPPVLSGTTYAELDALTRDEHQEPHRVLGAHPAEGGVIVLAWHP